MINTIEILNQEATILIGNIVLKLFIITIVGFYVNIWEFPSAAHLLLTLAYRYSFVKRLINTLPVALSFLNSLIFGKNKIMF